MEQGTVEAKATHRTGKGGFLSGPVRHSPETESKAGDKDMLKVQKQQEFNLILPHRNLHTMNWVAQEGEDMASICAFTQYVYE